VEIFRSRPTRVRIDTRPGRRCLSTPSVHQQLLIVVLMLRTVKFSRPSVMLSYWILHHARHWSPILFK